MLSEKCVIKYSEKCVKNIVNQNFSVFVNMVFDSKKLLPDAKICKIVHLKGSRWKLKAN